MTIEQLISKLRTLANQSILSPAQHEEVKVVMKDLKAAGLSNEEISQASAGKWSVSTVKGYCTGVNAPSPSPWQNTISLLGDVISAGLSLDDIHTSLAITNELKSKKMSIDDVVEFLEAADSAGLELANFVAQCKAFKESAISIKDVADIIDANQYMKENGLTLDSLPTLVKLAQGYGDTNKVLEAVSAYGSLQDLQKEIDTSDKDLQLIHDKKTAATNKLLETQSVIQELATPLNAYKQALKLGFGEKELIDLADLASKFGGPKAVMQSLKMYSSFAEIKGNIVGAKVELNGLRAMISETTARNAHLVMAIDMCQKLIVDYKLGPDGVSTIFSLAEKYGQGMEILRAIDKYGQVQAIQKVLNELEGKVDQKATLLAQLVGKYQEALAQLEPLCAEMLKIGAAVSDVEARLLKSKELLKLVTLIYDPISTDLIQYGPLVASVGAALLKWVTSNGKNLNHFYTIKNGLGDLISDLGGS